MAVVLVEGFDHFATASGEEKFWYSPGGGGGYTIQAPGRGFGGQEMVVINNNSGVKQLPASYTTIIAGAALKTNDAVAGVVMGLWNGSVQAAAIKFTGDQLIHIIDSTGAIIASGTTIVPVGSWFYVELKVIVGTSGHATVQLNGAPEIASSVGNFGTPGIAQIRFENHSLSGQTHIDDVVVLDTTGSSPQNDFLGDVRVETIYPVADGSYTAWTPDTGTDHFSRVNEHPIDGDASYVKDANPGDKDSYIMDTFLGSVYAAQFNVGARKGEAALRQLKPLIKQSGTDYLGDLATLSTDYLFYSWILDNDPSGSPWLAATINADEFGQELIT